MSHVHLLKPTDVKSAVCNRVQTTAQLTKTRSKECQFRHLRSSQQNQVYQMCRIKFAAGALVSIMRICAPCFLISLTLILDEQNLSDDSLDVRADCDSTILKKRESKLAARCHMDNTASWLTVRFTAIYRIKKSTALQTDDSTTDHQCSESNKCIWLNATSHCTRCSTAPSNMLGTIVKELGLGSMSVECSIELFSLSLSSQLCVFRRQQHTRPPMMHGVKRAGQTLSC